MAIRPAQIYTGSVWEDIGDKRVGVQEINTQTANYTLALTDVAKRVQMNNSAARTITIPLNSSVNFPVGTRIDIANINTGVLTVAAASGATVNGRALTLGQWETATLVQRAANTWVLEQHADLTAALGSKADYAMPANAQSGTTYTFALADATRLTTATSASAKTFTIPPQSAVTWAASSIIRVVNYGAGALTVNGGSGVTVTNTATTLAQFQGAAAIRTGSNTWTLIPFSGGAGNADFSDAATGTYTDGGGAAWKYIDYSATSTLTISRAGIIQVMLLAGGGGGAGSPTSGSFGGGGGAGGYIGIGTFNNARFTSTGIFLPAGTYTVTVGSGGAGGNNTPTAGASGGDTTLFISGGILAARGGGGGIFGSAFGTSQWGGCGGGGGSVGGPGIFGQGNDGSFQTGGAAGGGGGIGLAASSATGGSGLNINITGTATTYGTGGDSTLTFTTPTIGGGGDGYAGLNFTGQTGGNGRVVVRVRTN
jgi:hypothetical protein